MRLALLNDLPVAGVLTSGFGSGAEFSSGKFLWEGHHRGHIADVICPDYANEKVLSEYDCFVTKNVTRFPRQILEWVMTRKYVTWPSDYAWHRWRLFWGFQESTRKHQDLPFWARFFTKSVFNAFLSPLHKECHEWVMPTVGEHPFLLSPPAVDVDAFHPHKDGWEAKTAANTQGLLEFKGLKSPAAGIMGNLDWCYANPDWKVRFMGAARENVNLPPNAEYLGPVSRSRLIEVLGKSDTYFSFPATPQPYERTAIEAFLSCRRVLTNGNVGAASYPWFTANDKEACRVALRRAPAEFWERLEKEIAA